MQHQACQFDGNDFRDKELAQGCRLPFSAEAAGGCQKLPKIASRRRRRWTPRSGHASMRVAYA
jgi:hypothetical protein